MATVRRLHFSLHRARVGPDPVGPWSTIRGIVGRLIEWYGVYVYHCSLRHFEDQMRDRTDRNSTVYVYAIFAVTFVTRPIGSWFRGRLPTAATAEPALALSIDDGTCS